MSKSRKAIFVVVVILAFLGVFAGRASAGTARIEPLDNPVPIVGVEPFDNPIWF